VASPRMKRMNTRSAISFSRDRVRPDSGFQEPDDSCSHRVIYPGLSSVAKIPCIS
jgi:hypothetical protein